MVECILAWLQETMYYMLVQIGATWQIRLNDPTDTMCSECTLELTVMLVRVVVACSLLIRSSKTVLRILSSAARVVIRTHRSKSLYI